MAGSVRHLPRTGVADRRHRPRPARRDRRRHRRMVVRLRLFHRRTVLDRPCISGRRRHLRLAAAGCDSRPAGAARAVHGGGLRAGAADLDQGLVAAAVAGGCAHRQRMAARAHPVRLSLESVRLCARRTAGFGAGRLADRHLGHELPCDRDLRQPGDPDRRPRPHRAALAAARSFTSRAGGRGRLRRMAARTPSDSNSSMA
ncbi:hypothetical protein AFEL58S_03911 [Afipia felis]